MISNSIVDVQVTDLGGTTLTANSDSIFFDTSPSLDILSNDIGLSSSPRIITFKVRSEITGGYTHDSPEITITISC